jgi:hypothetical protein
MIEVVRFRPDMVSFLARFCGQVSAEWGHKDLQKGLAFGCDWSGTVVRLGRQGRSEILPRRLVRLCGASVVRRDAVMSRMEDLNVKICQEAITCKIITDKTAVVGEGGKALPTVC